MVSLIKAKVSKTFRLAEDIALLAIEAVIQWRFAIKKHGYPIISSTISMLKFTTRRQRKYQR